VIGAEKCPAKCIHPGKPLNPDEPGLEALMDRAAPFN
jgi:pyruvate-ferredoxin/flavodoxin oxidoreductase